MGLDIPIRRKNMPLLALEFLKTVQNFGYPNLTLKDLANSTFYQGVARNLLKDELHPNVMEMIMDFIEDTYS